VRATRSHNSEISFTARQAMSNILPSVPRFPIRFNPKKHASGGRDVPRSETQASRALKADGAPHLQLITRYLRPDQKTGSTSGWYIGAKLGIFAKATAKALTW